MCISTGKYTVIGQYPIAPRSESTSLKKGNAMASTVAITTNTVLQVNLNKLILTVMFLPMLIGYSLVTNFDVGHLILAQDSNALNTGWDNTCPKGNLH